MENLAALCCLWIYGFVTEKDYLAELDRLFLENPDDDFLLELENLGGDYAAAWARLRSLLPTANIDKFGKVLFLWLEKYFHAEKITLHKFCIRCYGLWCLLYNILPAEIVYGDPFVDLCYADEPLCWGDEKQSRELFQAMFDYYKGSGL